MNSNSKQAALNTLAVVLQEPQQLLGGANTAYLVANKTFAAQHTLAAVNSINIARVLAQSVYYLYAWLRLPEADRLNKAFVDMVQAAVAPIRRPLPFTAMGKGVANGMPLSVLTGRAEVMRLLERDVFFYSTFGGEALPLAAAHATLRALPLRC